jgi:hypothetical protein
MAVDRGRSRVLPFIKFNIEEAPDQMVVELRVPDEMSEALGVKLRFVTQRSTNPSS